MAVQGGGFGTSPPLFNLDSSTASITLNNAAVMGGAVTFYAEATHAQVYGPLDTPSLATQTINTLIPYLPTFGLIAGEAVSISYAQINIDNNSLINAASFTANALASSDAEENPDLLGLGIAISIVNTTAVVNVAGDVITTGDTLIGSGATNTVLAVADAGQNSLQGATPAVAVGVENSTSTVQIDSGAVFKVGGNLTVQAETVNNKALLARTVTGSDGKLGIGAAVDYTNDTTNALVDGNVIVKGNADVLADENQERRECQDPFRVALVLIGRSGHQRRRQHFHPKLTDRRAKVP